MNNLTQPMQDRQVISTMNRILRANSTIEMTVEISQNTFEEDKDQLGLLPSDPEESQFFSEEKVTSAVIAKTTESVFKDGERAVISDFKIEIRLSDRTNSYERSAYNFLTLIGDIGGFNGAIIILPTYLMSFYSSRMYQASVYSEMPVRSRKKRRETRPDRDLRSQLLSSEEIGALTKDDVGTIAD